MMSSPEFLVIARFAPDRAAGGAALRNLQTIRALAKLGPVDVLTVSEEPGGGSTPAWVREWKRVAVPAARLGERLLRKRCWLGWPSHPLLDRYHVDEAATWLRARLRRHAYAWVVIEELALARYADDCLSQNVKVVFDAHNLEGPLRAEMAKACDERNLIQWLRDRRLASCLYHEERRTIERASQVWACSAQDVDGIEAEYRRAAMLVPNGVDVSAYAPPVGVAREWRDEPLTLLFMGSFNYLPNEQAALRLVHGVLPAVRKWSPDARLLLVGRAPTRAMHEAAASDPGIEITGLVPSVLPYLHRPVVMVAPIDLGSGTRLKLLEAFAAGVPVVSTPKAAEGLLVRDGVHLLMRGDDLSMARAAVAVWDDPRMREQLVENALQLVTHDYSWSAVAARIGQSLGYPASQAASERQGAAAG